MTDDMNTSPVPAGDDWFDSWLSTGTVAQRSVDIYGQPGLLAEYEKLQRKLEVAEQLERSEQVELSNTEQRESTQILEKMEKLYEDWTNSKTTWFIRALSPEEAKEINQEADGLEEPDEKAPAAEKAAYREKVEELNERTDLMAIEKALVRVEDANGRTVMESINLPRLRALRDKVGQYQMNRLVQASLIASSQEPKMPVPLSRSNSKNARS